LEFLLYFPAFGTEWEIGEATKEITSNVEETKENKMGKSRHNFPFLLWDFPTSLFSTSFPSTNHRPAAKAKRKRILVNDGHGKVFGFPFALSFTILFPWPLAGRAQMIRWFVDLSTGQPQAKS